MFGSHLSSAEACMALRVTPETLYAYVSRGLIRSEPGPTPRTRRYLRADIEALQQRRELRHSPHKALRQSLDWGAPILDSSLTLISEGELYYRGENALHLALHRDFESVSTFFWTGKWKTSLPQVESPGSGAAPGNALASFQAMLPRQVGWNNGFSHEVLLRTAVRLVLQFATILVRRPVANLTDVVPALAKKWKIVKRSDRRLLETTLILCMDHELNVSSFTARCVASAGSGLCEVVNAAICAFLGFRHGGSTREVERLFEDLRHQPAGDLLGERLRRGETLPGFGHRLYPDGDPRAICILQSLRDHHRRNPQLRMAEQLISAGTELTGQQPNIDFSLVVLRRVLHLPEDSGVMIFALGRMVGWIAHALEQYQGAQLIRPRARYTGKVPSAVTIRQPED